MSKTAKCNVTLPLGGQIKAEAVQAVIERMGITKAAIYLRETMAQPVDYIVLKEKLFSNTSAENLYSTIKAK
jgi:hypothetical protein